MLFEQNFIALEFIQKQNHIENELNHLQQAIGLSVSDWKLAVFPARELMSGHFCRLAQ